MSLPLHPALVHIPLGLAFILPALAVGFAWAIWQKQVRPRAWAVVVVLLAVLLGAGFVALKTGHSEEERLERTVPEAAIAQHEALAEQFLWVTGMTLVVAACGLVLRAPKAMRAFSAATVVGTLLITGAALRAGHAGGQLVYVHNAGAAYAAANQANTETAVKNSRSLPQQSHGLEEDER